MTPASPPRVVRFERTMALALAAAAASAPTVAGAALALLAVLPGNAIWAVAGGFAAGAMLRRSGFRSVAAAIVLGAAWIWMPILFLGSSPPREGMRRICWHIEPESDLQLLVASAALTACALALTRGVRAIAGITAPAFAVVLLIALGERGVSSLRWTEMVLAAFAIVIAELARRRRDVEAVVLLGVTMAACVVCRHWLLRSSDVLGTAVAAMLLPLAYLGGALAADLEDGVASDDGTRLVVLAQRRPWATSVAIAAAIVGLGNPWSEGWYDLRDRFDVGTVLLLVPAAFAFLWHAGRGGRTGSDRLAPWLATNSAALVTAFLFAAGPWWNLEFSSTLAITLPLALWPLVCGVLLPGDPPGDETPFAVGAFALSLGLAPLAATSFVRAADAWAGATAFSILLVPLAFHAAVRSRLSSPVIVVGAVGVGILGEVFRPSAAWFDGSFGARPFRADLLVTTVWLVAGVLAVAARRCRSMTAVPRDHPIVEDFRGA